MIGGPGAPVRRRSLSASASGRSAASRAARPTRPAARVACLRVVGRGSTCAGLGRPAVDLLARLLEQLLEVADQVVGRLAAAADELRDELVGVAAGHPAALDGVVDDLLDPVAREVRFLEALRLRSSASRNACTLLSERPAEARRAAARAPRSPSGRVARGFAALARRARALGALGFAVWLRLALRCSPGACALRLLDFEPPDLVAICILLEPRGCGSTSCLRTISSPRPARAVSQRIGLSANVASTGAWSESRTRQSAVGDLAPLGRPRRPAARRAPARGRAGGRASSGAVGAGEPEAVARAARRRRSRAGRRLRSPPRTSGASPAHSSAVLGGAQDLLARRAARRARAGARVQVGDADLARRCAAAQRAGERHHPALGVAGPGASTSSRRSSDRRRGRGSGSSRPRWRRSGPG